MPNKLLKYPYLFFIICQRGYLPPFGKTAIALKGKYSLLFEKLTNIIYSMPLSLAICQRGY
jgi:hypothetical protein